MYYSIKSNTVEKYVKNINRSFADKTQMFKATYEILLIRINSVNKIMRYKSS